MNKRMVFRTLGQITLLEAALLLLPMIVSFIYHENDCGLSFLSTAALAAAIGVILIIVSRPKNRMIFAKEGFVIVSLSWVVLSLIGALPFTISGEIPSYVDALFETASGLTTTGASVLTNVESLSNGILFWRSFTHFIGGMGVLVLMMAIVPSDSGRSMNMLKAEMPGPVVGKLVPRIKETAKILYLIYIAITLLETVLLCIAGMPFFESLLHAFGTAGTGGFGLRSDSIGGYSIGIQWIITAFMLIFGVNFNLYYLLLKGKVKSVLKSRELWFYLGIVVVVSGIIALNLYRNIEGITAEQSVRDATFQVSSVLTTTGYSTQDFNLWPGLSRGILFILLFFGGCAGSTAGGLKLARVILLGKMVARDVRHLLHPHSVGVVKAEGKRVDSQTLNSVSAYFTIYCILIVAVFLLLCLEPFDIETNLSASISCVNNVGPGFGMVGPASGYAAYSPFSKIILTLAMLFGRLEIYPLLIAFTPSTWRKH